MSSDPLSARRVVIGVDIGTTSTKVVTFDASGARHGAAEVPYPLAEPVPGHAVQDPAAILAAVLNTLGEVVAATGRAGLAVVAVSFSSAMHSLMALDGRRRPLTPLITWADTRATGQAERLRVLPAGVEAHRRTGTPVHPMSPLTKLIWFRETTPVMLEAAALWVGIKEYVLGHLTGQWVTDCSVASGTGLMALSSLAWWPPALAMAGIDASRLPVIVPVTQRLALRPPIARQLGLEGVPIVVGGGDGPLANLGVGAVRPGVAACSLGTSGAVRVMAAGPGIDLQRRVFCYALTPEHWIIGGAVSNGGVVLDWVRQVFAPELAADAGASLLGLAAQAPAGSEGLVMLPYLLSERAPHWSALARGAYIGLTRRHQRAHMIRAALEGVCQQIALVLDAVVAAGQPVDEIRATGGFLRDPFTRQLLADVLGRQVHFAPASEGSAFGAALLGMQAVGLIDPAALPADLFPAQQLLSPEPAATQHYEVQRTIFDGLYGSLEPAFRALHASAPAMPAPRPVRMTGQGQVGHPLDLAPGGVGERP